LISKAAIQRNIRKSTLSREHQSQGAFNSALEDELLWRATKGLLEGTVKMRMAQSDVCGKLGDPSPPCEMFVD
jgi:hypothetical protein